MARGELKFMALKKTFENQDSETLNGYYRVREVHTQYEKDKDNAISLEANFIVELFNYDTGEFVGAKIQKEGPPRIIWKPDGIGSYSLTLPDLEPVQNLITRAYDHLKTLPKFDGATDC